MSGGHWGYEDQKVADEIKVRNLPKMMEALRKCFNEVDFSESGDTGRWTAEKRLYNIILELGNDLFGNEKET